MKKKLLLAFVLFFYIASSDIGIAQVRRQRVNLKDFIGNKYTFTKDSVYCGPEMWAGSKFCTGSAIKTDIAGKRYAVEFELRSCGTSVNDLICVAAVKLGHFWTKKWLNNNNLK